MPTSVRDNQATQAKGHSITIIASFGGIKYYVDPEPAQVISFQPSRPSDSFFSGLNEDLRPCTVISSLNDHLDKEDLGSITSIFSVLDDVWTSAFLEGETSRRHNLQSSMIAYNKRPLSSRYIPNTSNFEIMCCARRGPCLLEIRAYRFA